jgi:hypothetical protein
MSARLSTRDAHGMAKCLAARESFTTHGSLRGFRHRGIGSIYAGWLPADWRNTLQARSHVIEFVIVSYQTPVAWLDSEAGWVVPDEHYSVTTTRQTNTVRYAIDLAGGTVQS